MTQKMPLCSVLARGRGLDPIGHAGTADIFVTFELPLPWPYAFWHSSTMPEEIQKLIEIWYGDSGTPRPRLRPLAIAPDPVWSQEGRRRVMIHRRPEGPFSNFAKDEYLLPEGELGPLVWALLLEPGQLPAFDRYRLSANSTRDYLICTHGAVDAACAKFGYPLYRKLRDQATDTDGVRVWRVSHFGGHVFAPTLLELPAGRSWAYMDGDKPERLLQRGGEVSDFYEHYRGWEGLESSFLQVAEREMFMREGWAWCEYAKRGVVLVQDEADEPAWAEVQIDFMTPDALVTRAYRARVELANPVETAHSTASEETLSYPQYRVTRLEKVAG